MASNVDIAMRAKDEASQAFKSVEQRLKELNSAIDTIKAKGDVNLNVRDVANLQKLTSQVGQLERGLAQAGTAGAQAGRQLTDAFGGQLQGALGGLGLGGLTQLATGAGIAAAAVGVGKLTVELGQLGAQSLDTKRSFASVLETANAAPGLLNELKAAAGGTISQLRLMQLTNTALAGASAEFGSAFGAALPKLIEGARAAAQLNPALGDAEFLFQSLVTGIKRGSPMLIDNTGITLNLTEANEQYARSLGKSASELTEEEKKLALINATLGGVDRLVQQAGGNLDNMTSKQQSMKVATEELKTALGELVAKPYTVVVQQVTKGVTGTTDLLQGAQAGAGAWNPSADPTARLSAIEERLRALNALRERFNAGENLYRFNPEANQREIDALTQLQAAVTRYGDAAGYVMSRQAALATATEDVAQAQAALAGAVQLGDAAQVGYWQETLRVAQGLRSQAQAALDAATASNDWGDAGVNAAQRAAVATAAVTGGVDGVNGALAGSEEYWERWASFAEAAGIRAANAVAAARAAQGQTGGARGLDDWLNRDAEAANAASAARWGRGNATSTLMSGYDPVDAWQVRQVAANKAAAKSFGREYAQAGEDMARRIQGYLTTAMGNAKGLWDAGGGGADLMAPGKNGPFENLYRALDVAKNGDKSPWGGVIGKSQAEALKISQDFQRGIFSPEVLGLVNMDQLAQEAQLAKLAEQTQAQFAQQIAAKAGVGVNLVSNLFGYGAAGGGGKTGAVAEEQAGAAMKQVADSIGVTVKGKNFAGPLVGYGKTIWGYFEEGIIGAAKESDGLQRAIDGMVDKSISKRGGGAGGNSATNAARAGGVP